MLLVELGFFAHIFYLFGYFDKISPHDLILDLPCKDILEVLSIGNRIIGFLDDFLVDFNLLCHVL